jgi:hypothetical protein
MEKKGKAASALKAQLDARPSRLALKRAGIVKERLFGCDLAEHLQNVGRVGECRCNQALYLLMISPVPSPSSFN